jgi:hypothetical protein
MYQNNSGYNNNYNYLQQQNQINYNQEQLNNFQLMKNWVYSMCAQTPNNL